MNRRKTCVLGSFVLGAMVLLPALAAGQDGPLRGIRTYAVMIGALSGLNSVVGYTGERVSSRSR